MTSECCMKIFNCVPDENATGYYRAVLPGRHLAKQGYDITTSTDLAHLDYDVFILHRVIKQSFKPVIEDILSQGKRLWLELDDNLTNVPDWNPASVWATDKTNLELFRWSCQVAHRLIVSTSPLRRALAEWGVDA